MKINDVIKQVDLSKRAIKYYEEQGLLTVSRDTNGYRNYTEENILRLKTISVYRKLGISIGNIRKQLRDEDNSILDTVLKEKRDEIQLKSEELAALERFILNRNIEQAYEEIDYQTIADAIQDAIPGFTGYYFISHFLPYLQIKISTEEQREAYKAIINFWDNTKIKIPIGMKLSCWIMYLIVPKPSIEKMTQKMNLRMELYASTTPEQYEVLKKQVQRGLKIKRNPLYKYSPAGIAQRIYMKELQNKGYNDIFIPNMIKLSPQYKEYHEALMKINDRICQELNLYYDANYNLVQKNKALLTSINIKEPQKCLFIGIFGVLSIPSH